MKFIPIGILIGVFTFSASAQVLQQGSCSATDIRETNPKIRNNPEMIEHFSTPRDQDSIGWCYAFSAADLMSAEIGTPVSSIHASALYNKRMQSHFFLRMGQNIAKLFMKGSFKEVFEGGFASQSLKAMIKNGKVCKESSLPFDQTHPYETYSLIKEFEKLKASVKAKELLSQEVCQEVDRTLDKFQMMSVDNDLITESLLRDNMNITMEKLASDACKEDLLDVPDVKVKTLSIPNKRDLKKSQKFLAEINQILDSGRPIEMSYNVKHFTEMKGQHSSLIMGRRWNDQKGRCELQVRNSWGKSCASYTSNVECEYQTGTYWISDEDFIDAASDVRFIADK